jgi:hypothetical protein
MVTRKYPQHQEQIINNLNSDPDNVGYGQKNSGNLHVGNENLPYVPQGTRYPLRLFKSLILPLCWRI